VEDFNKAAFRCRLYEAEVLMNVDVDLISLSLPKTVSKTGNGDFCGAMSRRNLSPI
jgi:hypothetical protein